MSSVLPASTSYSTASGSWRDPVGGAADVTDDLVVVQPVGPLDRQAGQPVGGHDRTLVTPDTPLIACSSGFATSSATISGAVPG